MKILFSPSESKNPGGNDENFGKNSFIFENLYEKRLEILKIYNDFLKSADFSELSRIFGTKKEAEILRFRSDIFKSKTLKAILRYSGVAYKALNYRGLDQISQSYIDKNVLIFSNLFGPILAGEILPDYKLKQGEKFCDINVENFYNENFSTEIDKFCENDDILDIRAEFYTKFYEVKKDFLSMKFLKNGKVVSHFAKHYRGEILRQIAQNELKTNEEILAFNFKNLKILEIKKIKNKIEISYEIF